MKKLSRNRKLLVLSFIAGILLTGIWLTRSYNFSGKLRKCPDNWVSGYGMPTIGDNDHGDWPASRIYIKNKEYDAQSFDQAWIKNNCSVTEPEPLPV